MSISWFPAPRLTLSITGRLNVGAEFRNPGSFRPRIRDIAIRPSEPREVTAEVQFKVASNTVTDTTELRAARTRTGPSQHWEDHVVARLKLGSCRRTEPIDLRLGRGQHFTFERGQTPGERIEKRVEVVIVHRAIHPAI